jgi:hypothetical protein
MMTEKGTLPIGVEHDGKVHRDFEVRPRLVKDSIEVFAAEKGTRNDAHLLVSLMALQIVSLGEIPVERITTDLLLGMYEDDYVALKEVADRLTQRLKSFRPEEGDSGEGIAPGTAEDANPV